ncbi:MAG TPA: invasion associated locus B family protein [Pseudorhodoplanes sp.]|jgi:hypothetical protein|nr:invasion associated locus B family protein [Pseudorhodoplanes sp.]
MIPSSRRSAALAAALLLSWAVSAQAQTPAKPASANKPAAHKPAAKPPAKPAAAAKPAAQPAGAQPTLLGQFGDWDAYTASPGGKKICFAIARPVSSTTNPANRRSENMTTYMFVSSRPAEKVKDEVSLLIGGYVFKAASDATAQIGQASFPMYTQKDGAWIKNAAEEVRMVEAMRKAAEMTVKAVTDKGTETIDRFSLKGLDQALNRVAQECR